MASGRESGAKKDLEVQSLKDNFIPLFDGTPSAYREWRKRIMIYARKMQLQKREGEAVLNLLSSLQGSAWRILEDYDLEKAESSGAMNEILAILDKSFKYDTKVELPADFAAYFETLGRRGGQTLLQFVTEHDECLRRIQKHGVDIPSAVQGWHLLAKANLSREQRQLVMTQTSSLDRIKIQEALFTILGQDYKGASSSSRWKGKGMHKGRAYYVEENDFSEELEPSEYGYLLEDEYPDEHLEEFFWDDSEAGYYQHSVSEPHDEAEEEPFFDIQEFDEAYASYVDARRRFQDLKMSRGFLPVVALQDNSSPSHGSTDRPSSPTKEFGKKGGGKSKSKGKGKTTVHFGKSKPKGADPRGRAQAAMQSPCLRCGSTSHKTAQCTQASKPNSSGTKRQAVESVAAGESGLVIFEDSAGHERFDCAMLDPGASSFLMGYGPFLRYVEHLRDLGYPVDNIILKRADRTFFFGGDHQAKSMWTVHLPVFVKNVAGFVQGFLLRGETPMLLGRPVATALGLTVDFMNHSMRYHPATTWRPCLLGRQGEYLIPLTEDFDSTLLEVPAGFDLILEDESGPDHLLRDFLTSENVFVVTDGERAPDHIDDESVPLPAKAIKTLSNSVNCQLNEMNAYVTNELRKARESRPRVIWEVYTGESRTAQIAESLGAETLSFGIRTGWNFDQRTTQLEFLQLIDKEMPDEIYLSPTCSPWSRMQNISATTEERQAALGAHRDWHHRVHLRFVRRVYMKQITEGRHAHIEQPTQALSWGTSSLRGLPGLHCRFHQCQYGSVCMDTDGIWKPVMKDTTILSSKQTMAQTMNRLCDHSHEHCQLEGHLTGFLPRSRTSYLEDYQPALATTLATVMMKDEGPCQWSHGYAVAEHQQVGKLAQLHAEGKAEALRTVQRLHRGLGHPSTQALVELLQVRGASQTVLEVAASYQCAACQRYKRPNQPAPAAVPTATEFNQQLQADVMWVKIPAEGDAEREHGERRLRKFAVLSMLDKATKYQAAALIASEQGPDLLKGIERHWIAHFGPPHSILTDEGRGWASKELQDWTESLGVVHDVAPGEAHTRLGLVERRHAVLRKAIELYVDDLKVYGASGIKQALCYVVPQINAQPTVAGYSPSQWLFGYQPTIPGTLLADRMNPTQIQDSFENTLYRRTAARTALLQADVDQKLRRALLRRYAGNNQRLVCGQLCYYWRDSRQADLVKIRWRGPARVLMVEDDKDGKPVTYWLAHKTQLIRCAPHHVRPDFQQIEKTAIDGLESVRKEVSGLKSRGVTRFLDLRRLNQQDIDDVEDDEQAMDYDDDEEQGPKRRRLEYEDYEMYEPETPEATPVPPAQPEIATEGGVDVLDLPISEHGDVGLPGPVVPPSVIESEPSGEPEPAEGPAATSTPGDGEGSPFVAPAEGESFQEQRQRIDRQETMSFGPQRRDGQPKPGPYQRQQAEEDLNFAFNVEELDDKALPEDWRFNTESGYLELSKPIDDFWEVKAGCLIRHHLKPRRQAFSPRGCKDLPMSMTHLDPIRISVMRFEDGSVETRTDDFTTINVFQKQFNSEGRPWTGQTVFQINAVTRKEIAMHASGYEPVLPAKKVAKQAKINHQRNVRKEKQNKGDLNEKSLNDAERQLFYMAKVKELKSFFECGVWEFTTSDKADATRTLSSRMLLKWAKNPDGSPRAKARLVVRGYNDEDALGNLDTASPTATRLARALLLSVSATLRWRGWSADVATAFLQGLPQERLLWLRLPKECLEILGATADTRMLLRKPVYGQLDAPRRWYLEASRRLKSLGWTHHILDPCLFLLHRRGADGVPTLVGMISLHVDDMLGCGDQDDPTYAAAERALKEKFEFRTWDSDDKPLEYCGVHHIRKDDSWVISQEQYLKKCKPVTIHRGRQPEEEVNEHDRSQLRALLGSLQWPAPSPMLHKPHLGHAEGQQASCGDRGEPAAQVREGQRGR